MSGFPVFEAARELLDEYSHLILGSDTSQPDNDTQVFLHIPIVKFGLLRIERGDQKIIATDHRERNNPLVWEATYMA